MPTLSPTTPIHDVKECIQSLLNQPLNLVYLAEGAANIIYKVQPANSSLNSKHDNCCVLRMRKDLSFTSPAAQVVSGFQNQIIPLFTPEYLDFLMPQALYELSPELVSTANGILLRLESLGLRAEKRKGFFHPSYDKEKYGILMPNLSTGSGTRLLEFKPKWLVQSPSAPRSAVMCRTCALNAVRRAKGREAGRGDSGFCPLDLISVDNAVLRRALQHIVPKQAGLDEFVILFKMKVQPALSHLQKLQNMYGDVGLNDFQDPRGKQLSLAMALRDCSVFLNIDTPTSGERQIGEIEIRDVKFADLDLKSLDGGKLEKWAAMEKSLISSGAYTGLVESEIDCALGRIITP